MGRTPDWTRVERLFDAALERPEQDRHAWLAAECGENAALFDEVWSLLEADHHAAGFVSAAVCDVAAGLAADAVVPGTVLGEWRVAQELEKRRGAAVYLAHRGAEPAAVWVFDLANRADEILARFGEQRQRRARLTDPAILPLLDAGKTASGKPWIASGYSEGEPLTQYCRKAQVPLRDALALLARVCDVVQFAHQNLVVHQDLKAEDVRIEADGTLRLSGFGIADLIASPAEAPFAGMDVYGLGALLHEVITGRPPRPSAVAARLGRPVPKSLRDDLNAITRKALELTPEQRYGTAQDLARDLRRCLAGAPVEAQSHAGGAYRLRRQLRRYRLPVAAATALLLLLASSTVMLYREKRTAERRFRQVRHLADDLLFSVHDAIVDIPGSTKARLIVVEAALKHLDSVAGEAGDDPAIDRQLVTAYLRAGDVLGHPSQPNLGRVDEALVSYGKALLFATRLEKRFRNDPEFVSDFLKARFLIAKIRATRGENEVAEAEYRRIVGYLDGLSPQLLRSATVQDRFIEILQEVARQQLTDEGVATAYRAVTLFSADRGGDLQRQVAFGDALHALAIALRRQGRLVEAKQYYEKLLELRQRTAARAPANPVMQRMLAIAWGSLGDVQLNDDPAHNAATALPAFRQAAAIAEHLVAGDPHNYLAHLDLGNALYRVGTAWPPSDPTGAIEIFGRTADSLTAVLAREPRNVQARSLQLLTWQRKGELLASAAGRPAEGRELLRRTVAEAEAFCDRNPTDYSSRQALLNSYLALARMPGQDDAAALALARRAVESSEAFRDPSRRGRALRARVFTAAADTAAKSPGGSRPARQWYARALEEWNEVAKVAPLNQEDAEAVRRARTVLAIPQ